MKDIWAGCGLPFFIAGFQMSPYAKAVLAGIHFLALGCMLGSLGLCATDFIELYQWHWSVRPSSGFFVLALKGLPFLAGAVLFWKGRAIAEYLTKDLD
jgi:hypothetical protein